MCLFAGRQADGVLGRRRLAPALEALVTDACDEPEEAEHQQRGHGAEQLAGVRAECDP
ncbi:hypothetical protein [Micromonospora sp. DT31]|uniref:hypothetical protein n=1 Tax=Micromonospora sp. DT31 TaxID=3393434 RepID=UPI003CE79C5B